MKEKKYNVLEGIGLLLILFSFLVQLIETDIESEIRDAQFYQTQVKLDRLWTITSKDYSEKHPELNVHSAINFEGIDKEWKIYSEDKDYLDKWKRGVYFEGIVKWRIWIFILGSILVVIPKFVSRK